MSFNCLSNSYSESIESNVIDACTITRSCGILNFRLRDGSFTELQTPDDEEKSLVTTHLLGCSYSR